MAAPNNHRNGFARKNGCRPVGNWCVPSAARPSFCDVYPDEKQEAMLEPLAKFQERFDHAFFRALRELEETTENPPPNGPAARQRSPARFYRAATVRKRYPA